MSQAVSWVSAWQAILALAFYAANQAEMDGAIALESAIEASHA
jgi:hypothetical protein